MIILFLQPVCKRKKIFLEKINVLKQEEVQIKRGYPPGIQEKRGNEFKKGKGNKKQKDNGSYTKAS